jgi:hypothetical protein
MHFRLRYLVHDIELLPGGFLIGRGAECQLSLDDPLVSRRHAILRIRKDGVAIDDLASRNGVTVNGVKIEGSHELADGDKIRIGAQELGIYKSDELKPRTGADNDRRRATETVAAEQLDQVRSIIDAEDLDSPTQSLDLGRGLESVRLLCGVADKALAMGRADEAERILQATLIGVLVKARQGEIVTSAVAEHAARYAARLSSATGKGEWVDYIFDLYSFARRPPPGTVIDELYTAIRKVKSIDVRSFRAYLDALRGEGAQFGPSDRFLMQRLEGLERLVGLR